jgi:hypothetical protein
LLNFNIWRERDAHDAMSVCAYPESPLSSVVSEKSLRLLLSLISLAPWFMRKGRAHQALCRCCEKIRVCLRLDVST